MGTELEHTIERGWRMMIVEYGIGFNSKRELVVIEFNRTTGETKYIPLVVVDGKVVMATEEGE